MSPEERETHILFDHYNGEVTIFTTQPHVYKHLKERIGGQEAIFSADHPHSLYNIRIRENKLRKPWLIAPVRKKKVKEEAK